MARCVHPHRICIVSSALRQDKVTCRGAVKAHPADAPLIPYLAGVAHYSGPLQRRLAGSEMKKPTGLGRALLVAASHCACAHTLACGDFGGLHIHQTAADCLPSFEPEAMLGQGQGVESSGNPHAFVEFWGELCPGQHNRRFFMACQALFLMQAPAFACIWLFTISPHPSA